MPALPVPPCPECGDTTAIFKLDEESSVTERGCGHPNDKAFIDALYEATRWKPGAADA
jgi:hypothetical protein